MSTSQELDRIITAEQVEQAILTGELDLPAVENAEETHRAIVRRILGSETQAELLQVADTTPLQELEGIPLEISEVRFMGSAFDEGPPVYAVMTAMNLETGEYLTVTSGSLNVLAQLVAAVSKGWLPLRGMPQPSKQTAAGFKAWWLAAVPEPLRFGAKGQPAEATTD